MKLTSAAVYGPRPPSARACAAGESVGSSAAEDCRMAPPQAVRPEATKRATSTNGRDELITPSISDRWLIAGRGARHGGVPRGGRPGDSGSSMKTYCPTDLLVTRHTPIPPPMQGFSSPPRAGHIEPTPSAGPFNDGKQS